MHTSTFDWLCFYLYAVPIEKMGMYYYLEYGSLRVRWDEESSWFITLDETPNEQDGNEIRGLCGNFDRDPMSKTMSY